MIRRWLKSSRGELPEVETDELIKIVNLCKVYDTGAVKVIGLSNINLTIKKGEFVAIMGQSGSGKSTLMNILGCLDRPVLGHYYLDGIDISTLNEDQLSRIRNQKIGFVFQSFNLISRTPAVKNVELPMTYAHVPKRLRHERAVALLERVGLGKRIEHMPNEMSGGQRQRVLIARALAAAPDILILDDSSSALDYKTDAALRKAIRERHADTTTIIVAQRISSIMSLDDIIVLEEGKIIGHGTHDQLLEGCPMYQEIYRVQMGA